MLPSLVTHNDTKKAIKVSVKRITYLDEYEIILHMNSATGIDLYLSTECHVQDCGLYSQHLAGDIELLSLILL